MVPAIVPAWSSHLHLQHSAASSDTAATSPHTTYDSTASARSHTSTALYNALTNTPSANYMHRNNTSVSGDVCILAVPSHASSGTVLSTFDISGSNGLGVYPNIHNLNGLSSVSGKKKA